MEPRAVRTISNREKILVTATELFYRNGYQATSVDTILEQCGVAKSNFYYHYKTKEELACAVLERRFEEYETLTRCTLGNVQMPPKERLKSFFSKLFEAQSEIARISGCPFGNFAATLATSGGDEADERFRIRLCQFFRRLEGNLHACILEGAARSDFRSDVSPFEMAEMLLGTIQGLLVLAKTFQDAEMLRRGLETSLRLLYQDAPSN